MLHQFLFNNVVNIENPKTNPYDTINAPTNHNLSAFVHRNTNKTVTIKPINRAAAPTNAPVAAWGFGPLPNPHRCNNPYTTPIAAPKTNPNHADSFIKTRHFPSLPSS
jgi:hypothetical protein